MYTERHRRHGKLLVLAAFLACVLIPVSTGYAYHTDEERITDDTAYTLRDGEWRAGLWKAEYGVFDSIDLHTYLVPWLFGAGNAGIKWEYEWDDITSISLRAHSLKVDLTQFESDPSEENEQSPAPEPKTQANFWILPFEITYTQKVEDDMTLSAGWLYNRVVLAGGVDAGGDVNGAAAITTGQLTGTIQLKHSRSFATIIHARIVAYQDLSAQGNIVRTEVVPPDITLEFAGEAQSDSDAAQVKNGASIVASAQHSWSSMNIRYGLGYGNWSLPILNMVLPQRTPIVEFDVYWRF